MPKTSAQKLLAKQANVLTHATQCAVVFAANDQLFNSATALDQRLEGVLAAAIDSGDLKPKAGMMRWFPTPASAALPCKRVLLVHLGNFEDKSKRHISSANLRAAFHSVAKALSKSPAKTATIYLNELFSENDVSITHGATNLEIDDQVWAGQEFATTLVKELYHYCETKSKKPDPVALTTLVWATEASAGTNALRQALNLGSAIGAGINLARELGDLPPNICTPTYLAKLAVQLGATSPKLNARSLSQKQMEKMGMGALISVAKGSSEEAKLIIMEYKGNKAANSKPHVLVGKGITFDTGGISLKPGANMDEMKYDMCGAASVFGTIKALIEMDANLHVVGLVAAAENMPNGNASKPGDVVTSMSGQTIEILNTDAEGRLVLCDTLTYAERYKPKTVVDIATLTGACVVALGNHASALYSNHQPLADALLSAGNNSGDRAWQMPLWDDYQKQLHSNFADMANIGGMPGGSITAACFLSRFAKKYHWAHLDIAGVAWKSGAAKGATGRPVSLLVTYLLNT